MSLTPEMVALAAALELTPFPVEAPDYAAIVESGELRAGLFAEQRDVVEDPADTIALRCARRAGKTHTVCVMLAEAGQGHAQAHALYITLTRANAEELIWEPLKALLRAAGLPFKANESKLRITFPNGGRIRVVGADDTREIQKIRGHAYDLVVVDECGAFPPPLLMDLRDNVVEPALADRGGRQVYAGTPGETLSGVWYWLTRPEEDLREAGVSLHHWTAAQNVAVPGLWERMLATKAARGWQDDHPTWVREYLGQWVQDRGALVFPFSYDLNNAHALPRVGPTGADLRLSGWRWVMGVDVGYVDATAFSVVAAHALDPSMYVVHVEKHREMIARQVALRIRGIRSEVAARVGLPPTALDRSPIVMDTGGQGKPHAEECTRVFGLGVTAAEKRDKESAVRLTRGELIAGRLKILSWEHCDQLREEWSTLGWDPDRRVPNKSQEDHGSDATLYALRRLRHYRTEHPEAPPGTARAAELEMMAAAELRAMGRKRRGGRYAWDR